VEGPKSARFANKQTDQAAKQAVSGRATTLSADPGSSLRQAASVAKSKEPQPDREQRPPRQQTTAPVADIAQETTPHRSTRTGAGVKKATPVVRVEDKEADQPIQDMAFTKKATSPPLDALEAVPTLADAPPEPKHPSGETPVMPPAADHSEIAPPTVAPRDPSTATPRGEPQESSLPTAAPAHVDRVRFVQRVARAFQTMGDRSGSVRLRLSPPELGSLRLEIAVRNGAMSARVEAETPAARNLLLDNLPALRERLAQQDIKVERFNVDLMDQSPDGPRGQTADYTPQQHRGETSHTPSPTTGNGAETQTAPAPLRPNRPGEGTRLNVLI
jgi:flagellar hook-length control protein FliK